ncbi:DNA gyrase subunit B [soil metagenome]
MSNDDTSVVPVSDAPVEGGGEYGSDSVQIYKDAEHIRHRPGMYIGDTGTRGLHHLVYELIYNSVDEALAGYCKNIVVKIHVDRSISCSDDGRGIPVEMHASGRSTLEVVLTTAGAGAKFDKRSYKTSAGLHGIGAKAVTALSEWTEAEIRRNGKVYVQEFAYGKATTQVREIGISNHTGSKITFRPDTGIFKDTQFEYDILEQRMRELAFLNKSVSLRLVDERTGKDETYFYAGGVAEYVEYLNRVEETLHKAIPIEKTLDDVRVEVAIQYTTGEEERVRCYTNNAYNPGGGTHMSGFRAALTRTLNGYGTKENLFKKDLTPIGEDFREGITAIISVQVPEPQFESQTKIKLNNPEVEGIVSSVVQEMLGKYLEENPKDATKIMKKVILAAEAREAAAKAKKDLKNRKNILNSGGLPGKLMDCTTRDRDQSELFLVEGQSAGGSAESGRDRHYQAVLPLRGKVLNVEKATHEKLLKNEEISCLISAVGVDIGNTEETSKVRYGKIIILTDADVDGQHIRTLLLTFFYRQMRKLVEDGRIFVARPPLFKVSQKKQVRYVQAADQMNTGLMARGLEGAKLHILSDQKAGEVSATIEGERLTKLVRVLSELEDSLGILERRGFGFADFLTRNKGQGLPLYRVLMGSQTSWFLTTQEVDEFRLAEEKRLGHELLVGDDLPAHSSGNGDLNNAGATFFVQEFHEVRNINRGLERIKEFGLTAASLVDAPRIAGREPLPRFQLESREVKHTLAHVRILPTEIRHLGEKGISITRFKGMGEMDGEELWETTLDPAKRTLLRVNLDNALMADEMFRVLMGEKVEPRRDFIQKHALDVKEIDYHGA